MNEYLIRTSDAFAYFPENPDEFPEFRHVEIAGKSGTDEIVDVLHVSNPLKAGDTLIGGWNRDGEQVEPVDVAEFEAIRPLGNYPPRDVFDAGGNVIGQTRGGDATNGLLYSHCSGWAQRQLGTPYPGTGEARLYPEDNEPFDLEIRHKEFTGNPNPAWDGWGWRAEMIGDAATRDPGVYAIGVYSDPECTQYLYTTGSFVRQLSDWQVDEQGGPIEVWATETPVGRANPAKEPWHLACLFASLQAGYQTLWPDDDASRYLFWEDTQGV